MGESTYFYSRPCERGDEIQLCSRYVLVYFYSRPCERGDPDPGFPRGTFADFYSRPCERGDKFCTSRIYEAHISTHAPARGATAVR